MPHSYSDFRAVIIDLLLDAIPDRETRIIDVGAGDGSFGAAIRARFPNTDAMEIWQPYIDEFQLSRKYRRVYVMRAQDIADSDVRGAIFVFGDIIEHMEASEAQLLLRRLIASGARMIVIKVPWMYEQGPGHPDVLATGNVYEIHKQPDLTPEIFEGRYPEMSLVAKNERCGVYVWGLQPPST